MAVDEDREVSEFGGAAAGDADPGPAWRVVRDDGEKIPSRPPRMRVNTSWERFSA